MIRNLSLFALLSITCLGLTACGEAEDDNNKTQNNSTTGGVTIPELTNPFAGDAAAATAGATLYSSNCSGCHGPDGGPTTASNNKDLRIAAAMVTDGYLFTIVEKGGPGVGLSASMPPYGGSLSEDEIWQVATHVRTLAP